MSKNPGVVTPRNCDPSVRLAIQQLSTKIVGFESTPQFAGLKLTDLTDSKVVYPSSSILTSASFLHVDATNSRFGVGVSTPNNALQVLDLISFDDSAFETALGKETLNKETGSHNTAVGYQAGYNNDTTGGGSRGLRNVFMGAFAGYGLGGSNTGYRNVAIGYQTLYDNTSGNNGVAIGYLALSNNTTGIRNVAIGSEALTTNTGGKENIALGYRALRLNASGDYNMAIGEGALETNSAGDNNVAVGAEALNLNTGSNNSSIGFQTLNANTSGANNVGIGIQAGFYNKTGDGNTFIGALAGYGAVNQSNDRNTMIGGIAGRFINTGIENTCLGYGAGYNVTTGDSNVFLGYVAGFNQTTISDRLIIHNQDPGSIAAEITNSLMYGIFDATPASQSLRINVGTALLLGDLGIGSGVSPDSALHILGTNAQAGGLTFESSAGTAGDRLAIYPKGNFAIIFKKLNAGTRIAFFQSDETEQFVLAANGTSYFNTGAVTIGHTSAGADLLLDVVGNARIGDGGTDITPDDTVVGHLIVRGNGYNGFVALDATAMYIGHNSSIRALSLMTDETLRINISGAGVTRIGTPGSDYTEIGVTGNITQVGAGRTLESPKYKLTAIGGYAVMLTNKTGGNTVAGQLVAIYLATAVDDAFKTAAANDDGVIGIILDAGVADGSEAWIVVSGIADVLMDGGGSARGDRVISSATAGSADVWNVGGAVATHFLEIGHCIETRGGAGLARCIVHFN